MNLIKLNSQVLIIVPYEAYGFIYANGKGKATITAEHDNVKDTIEVEVKDTKSMFTTNLENVNNKFKMVTSTLPRSEVDWILNRARQMVYLSWTPTKNLCGWGVQNYFKANNTYQGIPYSQANQVDDSKFIKVCQVMIFTMHIIIMENACRDMEMIVQDLSAFI